MLDGTGVLDDSSFLATLDPALAVPFQAGFADAVQLVFWIAAAITVLGLVVVSLLPEVPLRTKSAMEEREDALAEEVRAEEALAGQAHAEQARADEARTDQARATEVRGAAVRATGAASPGA